MEKEKEEEEEKKNGPVTDKPFGSIEIQTSCESTNRVAVTA
jgi:hypothetical protein